MTLALTNRIAIRRICFLQLAVAGRTILLHVSNKTHQARAETDFGIHNFEAQNRVRNNNDFDIYDRQPEPQYWDTSNN